MISILLTRLLLFRIVGLVGHRMFTVYTLSSKLADVMADTRPLPFSPVYYGMQFRAAPPEQPARQITALFASPGTSKRNKDLRTVATPECMHRGCRCIANRETIAFNSLETLCTPDLSLFFLSTPDRLAF